MKSKPGVWGIFLLGLSLRIGYGLHLPPQPQQPDAWAIDGLAHHLATAHQYGIEEPTAIRPPFYPFFLAGLYSLFGSNYSLVRVVQAFLDMLGVLLLMQCARRLSNHPAAPWLAGLIGACYPYFIYYQATFLTESIQPFLVILAYWTFLRWRESLASLSRAVVCGGVFAILTLTRPAFLMVYAVILLVEGVSALIRSPESRSWFAATCGAILFAILIGSWGLRNQRALGQFTLDSHGGPVLYECIVYYDAVKSGRYPMAAENNPDYRYGYSLPEVARDHFFRQKVREYVHQHRRDFLMHTLANVRDFWRFYPRQDIQFPEGNRRLMVISLLTEPCLILGGAFGLWWTRRQWRDLYPIYASIIVISLLHILTTAQIRYRLPLMTYLILLFSCAVAQLFPRNEVISA